MALANAINIRDIRANQPAAAPANEGCFFIVSDEGETIEYSDGATWVSVGVGGGAALLVESGGQSKVSALAADAAPSTDDLIATVNDPGGTPANKKVTLAAVGTLLRKVVQQVNTQTGAVATGTTAIPVDDTIPQNTEGTEFMTLAITPTSATNKLKIEVVVYLSHSAINQFIAAAIFQDATANALAVQSHFIAAATGNACISFTHYMTAGTTSSTTFKVRAGGNTGATVTFNGQSGGRMYGGVLASSITITEIVP